MCNASTVGGGGPDHASDIGDHASDIGAGAVGNGIGAASRSSRTFGASSTGSVTRTGSASVAKYTGSALPAPAQPLPQEHRAARSVPIEPDALIHRELAQDFDLMYELAHFVRASGYRCDSISALQPLPPARGYKLVCNRFSYKYAIDNKDGRSIVTAE